MPDCWNDSDPPTSTLLATTLGMTRVIDQTSMRFGRACSVSWLSTVCFNADVVSSNGDFARHDDPLFQLADRQAQIGAGGGVGIDDEVALLDGAEPLHLRPSRDRCPGTRRMN